MRLIWEDCAHGQRTRSPLLPHRPRQSRGRRTRTGEIARARSRTVEPPCSKPGERDRDTSELFLLPYTPSTSTRTRLFPVHRPQLFVGRALERDAAHPNRRPARFTTRDDRFGGPPSHCGGLLGRTHARDDLPLTPLSRTSLRYRCVPFRGARWADSERLAETASTPPP